MNSAKDITRRKFVKTTALAGAGLGISMTAKSYSAIPGSNDRLRFAVIGLNGRGKAHIAAITKAKNAEVTYVCDVDQRTFPETLKITRETYGTTPKTETDFRKLLEDKDIDAVSIATPDHWHAPMTIMAVSAGKDVYVEKPCTHNPHEGELLIEAQKKYGKVIQMGTQQRSAPTSIQAIADIHNGLIGEAYFGRAWYANDRKSIGFGKKADVPPGLDWDLWQGPAPRREYHDNWVHYNWHWFWNWGSGEINNNGTHEIDICRWALAVDFPVEVNSSGGRYAFKDDWQFYDTQVVNYQFPAGKMISWEGRSCNPFHELGWGRGSAIYGTNGTVLIDRNNYLAYDMTGKLIKEMKEPEESATTNTIGEGALDVYHMNNFLDAIRENQKLHSPIDAGHVTNLLCHLGNIAQKTGKNLKTDPENGKILNNEQAMKMWRREYEPGWEPKV